MVATPIGNLEDMTFRAVRTLREVKLIAAEDTRKTKVLLNAYDIKTPMTSYHEHNKLSKLDYLLGFLKEEGEVALVSDAGTPGMSDPGYELIAASAQQGIPVVPVPGPSAVVTALTVSGLDTKKFTYLGFLPRRQSERRRTLTEAAVSDATLVILEAPHRLLTALNDMLQSLGDRRIAVCRELTKIHEEVFRGTISQAAARFTEPRGEFVLVVEGKPVAGEKPQMNPDVEARLRQMRNEGVTARVAVAEIVAETGLPRKEVYRAWLKQINTKER